MDLCKVMVIGRLIRDAELKTTQSGFAVSKFSIAVNYRKKNGDRWEDEASFFDVSLLGKQAETLSQYLQKGKQVAIDGELRQERWQQEGQNRSKIVIIANSIQLLGSNGNSQNNNNYQQNSNNTDFNPGASW